MFFSSGGSDSDTDITDPGEEFEVIFYIYVYIISSLI